MNKLLPLLATTTIALTWANSIPAQSALKRLEEQIRAQRSAEQEPVEARSGGQVNGAPQGTAAEVAIGQNVAEAGYLGIQADDEPMPVSGVCVLKVHAGSSADIAGMRPQDLITAVEGTPIHNMGEMAVILQRIPAGGKVGFDVRRGEASRHLEVTLGRRSSTEARQPESAIGRAIASPPALPLPPPLPAEEIQRPVEQPLGDQARIEVLEARIRELEKRVAELEKTLRERL